MAAITPLESARRLRAARDGYIDLVNSSFRTAGIVFPERWYRLAWDRWRAAPEYVPSGRGGAGARRAVASFLTDDGVTTGEDQIILTGGSSVSYHLLFTCLARAHSGTRSREIALPRPGYPLFEELVRGAGLTPRWYDMERCPDTSTAVLAPWDYRLQPERIRPILETRPVALVLISPNNPTGAVYDQSALGSVLEMCAATDTPVISDEVFSSFRPPGTDLPRPAAILSGWHQERNPPDLTVYSLNGLSKICAAPEIKLGWIAVHGKESAVRHAVDHLDTLHDTFLTVSGFAEAAAELFLSRDARDEITRIAHQVHAMRTSLAELTGAPGGIHRIIRLEAHTCAALFGTVDDAEIAEQIVSRSGVYMHPGYLYGLDPKITGMLDPAFVITCLHDRDTLRQAMDRLTVLLRGDGPH